MHYGNNIPLPKKKDFRKVQKISYVKSFFYSFFHHLASWPPTLTVVRYSVQKFSSNHSHGFMKSCL